MRRRAWRVVLASLLSASCASSTPPPPALGAREAADAIVVLGHRPPLDRLGQVDYETRARMDRGIELLKAQRAPRLLVSGGASTPEAVEANVMATYAEARGVPAAIILREGASGDTIENAQLSVALLRSLLADGRAPRVILVTSDYHIARAARLFACAGARVLPEAVALPELSAGERKRRERSEQLVSFAYLWFDECARAARQRAER